MTRSEALQCNIDAAQRELDGRAAQGEDVSRLRVCQRTAAIIPAAALILNPAQAEAVYSAMCALNNVCGRLQATFDGGLISVEEVQVGTILVSRFYGGPREVYASQADFAIAYRVDGSAALLADALAEPAAPIPAGFLDDESEAHPDNHGPLSNLPHDA